MKLSKKQIKDIVKVWASNVLFAQQDELIEDLREILEISDECKEQIETQVFLFASKLSLETFKDISEILEHLDIKK